MPLGITSVAYVNLGSYDVPTFTPIQLIGDLSYNPSWNLGDVQQEPTNMTMEITGRIRKNMNNTPFLALRAAFLTTAIVDIMILDGPMTLNGVDGIRNEFKVSVFSEDQALQNVVFKDFTLVPCITDRKPQSVIVNAGAPDFTDIDPPVPAP